MADGRTEKQKVKEITDRLEEGLKELFEGEKYKSYLNTMSKFHNYSANNIQLIEMQCPDATYVAGYKAWQRNFERHVNKGERGIRILAPAPYKIKEEQEKIDPVTNEPVLDRDGMPVMEEVEIKIPAFRVVTVFDYSQTDGKELPGLGVSELHGDVERYRDFMEALERVSPVPIRYEGMEGDRKGYFIDLSHHIAIKEGMSEAQTAKTGVHEVTHAKLHAREVEQDTEKAVYKDRETKEVEAESVAYTVCQHFGIDTSDYSFGYIAGWSSGKEMSELKSSLDIIRRTSSELIKGIETQLLEIEKERATEQAQEDILLLVANTDRSEYDLLNVKGMERADLLNALLSMKDDDRQSMEAYLERAGAWVTPLANERSEEVGEYHLDYAYNTDTHEITDFKALQEERKKANIPVEYGDVIVRISTPDSGEYETIKITNMQSEVANVLYAILFLQENEWNGNVLDYLQEKGFEFVPIMRSGGLNDGYPQFYDFDVDMSELEVHTASELPATVQAEQLINRMEFHRSVYDTDERNLIMNHAYKLDDMYKTTSLAHSIAEQKDDLPLLWETIRTAEEEIDALPDGMAGLSQMHEYGYSWDEMLPLTKDKASELFGEDVAVYQLHADGSETLVEDRAALEGHDGLFGVEKGDWNAYKEYQSMKQELEDSEANREAQLLYGNGGSKDIGEVPVMDSTAEVPENTVESGIQGEQDSDKFTYYVIEDLSARVGNNPEKGEVERFGNLAEAIGRFKEYREREDADQTGMTKAVFGFGINGKEFDVLHVKNNQNCVPLEFTQKEVEHSQFKSDLQALYYEVGFDRAEIYRERLPEETKDLVKELFEIQLKTSGINNVSLYMDRFDTLYEQGKMEKLMPKGEQNYVLENIPFVEWKNPYIDVNARETAEQAQDGKQTVVTLTVAECGEFHNFGEYHENIAGVEEAIAIFNQIPPERMNGIPSIGINIHTEGTESYEDTQMDIVSGGVADLEFLDYVPDITDNPKAVEVIAELIDKLPDIEVRGSLEKWQAAFLAAEIDQLSYDFDTYEYRDTVDDREAQIANITEDIRNRNTKYLNDFLNAIVSDSIREGMADIFGEGTELDDSESVQIARKAKELLDKLAEYKPLAKVEELEECNYNMIDNILNNEKPKEEKQAGRVSIKEKLAEKKAVIEQMDKSEREVPEKGTEKKSEREI
ncbi:DUF4316 domain-containing protein [Lachnospiraceae bacterium WCA-9-b2]|uniref:DUF4316 domain-containing protein n=1 Tax=Sporofaciens musculi TaxID=2681861 RepID=A0A7X3SIH0_9FIRM|nr:ArdC-like ssDNA-binding domain-containing protein [Sporofaciens musculi]MXP75399.1 DUF4316 domain-containing protein [Sporofaciens musculi]